MMNYGSLYLCEGPLRAMFYFLHFNGRCSDSVNFGPKYPIIQYCIAVDDKFYYMGTFGLDYVPAFYLKQEYLDSRSTRYLSTVYVCCKSL